MNWLVWKQHRSQFAISGIFLTALSFVLVLSGVHIDTVYRSALTTCRQSNSCDNLGPQVFAGDGFFFDIVNLTIAVGFTVRQVSSRDA